MAAEAAQSVTVLKFGNVKDLFEYMDKEIAESKKMLGDMLREVEKIRVAADLSSKLEELLKDLGGAGMPQAAAELELDGVKVYVNPTPRLELQVLVDAIKGMQERILQLERARKSLEPLSKLEGVNASINVILEGGNVKTVIIKVL
ncbi:MAG: hypothetical protein F7B17_06165 [Desulfurococcales archaeon]|nr:hypothetical protein [Desulfurococcales archaeon]